MRVRVIVIYCEWEHSLYKPYAGLIAIYRKQERSLYKHAAGLCRVCAPSRNTLASSQISLYAVCRKRQRSPYKPYRASAQSDRYLSQTGALIYKPYANFDSTCEKPERFDHRIQNETFNYKTRAFAGFDLFAICRIWGLTRTNPL